MGEDVELKWNYSNGADWEVENNHRVLRLITENTEDNILFVLFVFFIISVYFSAYSMV